MNCLPSPLKKGNKMEEISDFSDSSNDNSSEIDEYYNLELELKKIDFNLAKARSDYIKIMRQLTTMEPSQIRSYLKKILIQVKQDDSIIAETDKSESNFLLKLKDEFIDYQQSKKELESKSEQAQI